MGRGVINNFSNVKCLKMLGVVWQFYLNSCVSCTQKLTTTTMYEMSKKVLTRVSFDRALFKKELNKARKWLKPKESLMLKAWCLATFGHVYRDVILEVFETIS